MDTLEQLGRHLAAVEELAKIVRTMKSLAAASVHQYERAVRSLSDYYRTVELGLNVVLQDMPPAPEAPRMVGAPAFGVIIFGSDHGLCGRFNEELATYVRDRLSTLCAAGEIRRVLFVGARVAGLLEGLCSDHESDLDVPGSPGQVAVVVKRILLRLDTWQRTDRIGRVYLFYNRPVSASAYHATGLQLLPINLRKFQQIGARKWPGRTRPAFSMTRDLLLARLLRQYIFVSLQRACVESLAAENSSRLVAMQAAEQNLRERRDLLQADLRRQRQESITEELLDIVAGYEVLRSRSR